MSELVFTAAGIGVERFAAQPTLRLGIEVRSSQPVEHLSLQCQLRIELRRRTYDTEEHEALRDLFGEGARWRDTLKSLLWTIVSVNVPAFRESAAFNVMVPCTFDFNVAATKYFQGLKAGEAPISLLFSGSIFYLKGDQLRIAQVPWSSAVQQRIPVQSWRSMMNAYYPNVAWVCIERDVFERLYRYKRAEGLPTFEMALQRLLDGRATPPEKTAARAP